MVGLFVDGELGVVGRGVVCVVSLSCVGNDGFSVVSGLMLACNS